MSGARALEVRHTTSYRYARPVCFGQHRVMFLPRSGHDIRVLDAGLDVNVPANIDWIQDTQSNWVTLVTPKAAADKPRSPHASGRTRHQRTAARAACATLALRLRARRTTRSRRAARAPLSGSGGSPVRVVPSVPGADRDPPTAWRGVFCREQQRARGTDFAGHMRETADAAKRALSIPTSTDRSWPNTAAGPVPVPHPLMYDQPSFWRLMICPRPAGT